MFDDFAILSIMASVFFVSFLSIWVSVYLRNARHRLRDLKDVAAAMRAHYDALEIVLDSEQVSEPLKNALYSVHLVSTDREMSNKLVSDLFLSRKQESAPKDEINHELDRLPAVSADLYEAVATVVKSGMLMSLLRWPETATRARQLTFEMSIDEEQERAFARVILGAIKSKNDNHHGGINSGGFAHA